MIEKLSNREKEASVIAGRIHELIRHQTVKDKKTEQMRPGRVSGHRDPDT